jgi:hypothetical protein
MLPGDGAGARNSQPGKMSTTRNEEGGGMMKQYTMRTITLGATR